LNFLQHSALRCLSHSAARGPFEAQDLEPADREPDCKALETRWPKED